MPRELVVSPSLEICKVRLDGTWSNPGLLGAVSLHDGWMRRPKKSPFQPNQSHDSVTKIHFQSSNPSHDSSTKINSQSRNVSHDSLTKIHSQSQTHPIFFFPSREGNLCLVQCQLCQRQEVMAPGPPGTGIILFNSGLSFAGAEDGAGGVTVTFPK